MLVSSHLVLCLCLWVVYFHVIWAGGSAGFAVLLQAGELLEAGGFLRVGGLLQVL